MDTTPGLPSEMFVCAYELKLVWSCQKFPVFDGKQSGLANLWRSREGTLCTIPAIGSKAWQSMGAGTSRFVLADWKWAFHCRRGQSNFEAAWSSCEQCRVGRAAWCSPKGLFQQNTQILQPVHANIFWGGPCRLDHTPKMPPQNRTSSWGMWRIGWRPVPLPGEIAVNGIYLSGWQVRCEYEACSGSWSDEREILEEQ